MGALTEEDKKLIARVELYAKHDHVPDLADETALIALVRRLAGRVETLEEAATDAAEFLARPKNQHSNGEAARSVLVAALQSPTEAPPDYVLTVETRHSMFNPATGRDEVFHREKYDVVNAAPTAPREAATICAYCGKDQGSIANLGAHQAYDECATPTDVPSLTDAERDAWVKRIKNAKPTESTEAKCARCHGDGFPECVCSLDEGTTPTSEETK